MPRYFFDSDDGDRIHHDGKGLDLPDADTAIEEACRLALDLFHGVPRSGRTIIACVVRDEAGNVAHRLMLDVSGEVMPTAKPS